jgi:hypothetical protein
MKILTLAVFSYLMLHAAGACSQVVKRRATIILHDYSQKYGWIDFDDWTCNPVRFRFYDDSLDRKGRYYDVSQVRYFQIYNLQSFLLTEIVDECTRFPARVRRQPKLYERLTQDSVFMRLVILGTYTFAEYTHYDHIHYYIFERNTPSQELDFNEYDDQASDYAADQKFRQQLIGYVASGNFNDQEKTDLMALIAVCERRQDDVKSFIKALNRGRVDFEEAELLGMYACLSVGGTLGYGRLTYSQQMPAAAGPELSLFLGVGIQPSAYKHGPMIRASVSTMRNFFDGFSMWTSAINFSGYYSFLLPNGMRIYSGPSFNISNATLSKEATSKSDQNWPRWLGETWLTMTWHAGLITCRHWEVSLYGNLVTSHIAGVNNINPTEFGLNVYKSFNMKQVADMFTRKKNRPVIQG